MTAFDPRDPSAEDDGKNGHDHFRDEYQSIQAGAEDFMERVTEQLRVILKDAKVETAVEIESRLKSLDSINEKVQRGNLTVDSVVQIEDLIGIRIICHFKRGVDAVCEAIKHAFHVLDEDDVSRRLGDREFGYQSIHVQVKIPQEWRQIPSLRNAPDLSAEIQVRTVAQHAWAAAAHILSYKAEDQIPHAVLRSIHRVAALLETADLEFERVLQERDDYLKIAHTFDAGAPLDVDVVRAILDKCLPAVNQEGEAGRYGDILDQLRANNIDTVGSLLALTNTNLHWALELERKLVEAYVSWGASSTNPAVVGGRQKLVTIVLKTRRFTTAQARLDRGVFFSHRGLVNVMLKSERYRSVALCEDD